MNKLIVLSIIFMTSFSTFCQFLEDGKYNYINQDWRLSLTISENGEIMDYFCIENSADGRKIESSSGHYMSLNPNGIDDGYKGPLSFYETVIDNEMITISYDSESSVKLFVGQSLDFTVFSKLDGEGCSH